MRVPGVDLPVSLLRLVHLLDAAGVLLGHLPAGRSVADGRELRATAGGVVGTLRCVGIAAGGARFAATVGGARAVLFGFALVIFVLLALLPFFANLFEFWKARENWSAGYTLTYTWTSLIVDRKQ